MINALFSSKSSTTKEFVLNGIKFEWDARI
jgi:hypothetical protein